MSISPERRAELDAKFGLAQRDNWHNTAHPGVEQIAAAQATPHNYAAAPTAALTADNPDTLERVGQMFTPWYRRPEVVQDKLTELMQVPHMLLDHPVQYVGKGLTYLNSNLPGRRAMPLRDQPYSEAELRAELINRADNIAQRREALVAAERNWPLYLRAATLGPSPVVIIHETLFNVEDSRPGERLPNGEPFAPTLVAFPAPHGYSAFRVARVVWDLNYAAYSCRFCDDWMDPGDERLMLVSSQGALHVIPTCHACADEIGPGPDYYDPNNAEEARRGYPADEYR